MDNSQIRSTSVESSRRQSTSSRPSTSRKRSRRETPQVEASRENTTAPDEPLILDQPDLHSGLRKATFEDPQVNTYIKKLKWTKFQDGILKQMRSILTENYQATLQDIPGSTDTNISIEAEGPLRAVAKSINATLKNTLVPGELKDNILNSKGNITEIELDETVKAYRREEAIKQLRIDKLKQDTIQQGEELRELEQKLLATRDKLNSRPIAETRKLDRYTYSLLAEPKNTFNLPKKN